MHFDFDEKLKKFLKAILLMAFKNNVRVFFAGGIVRDSLLNKPVKDVDLTFDCDVLEFSKLFPPEIKIKSIHKPFKTIKVEFDGLEIDMASTRTETYPYSGCLPVVDEVGVDIEKDYKRRDFSINSMYFEITLEDDELKYNLIDFSNGVNDLKNGVLRVLHNKSYIDDPTRILRGLEFKHRFNFDFSSYDYDLINDFIKNINLENASKARILSVFDKILSAKKQDEIFREIIDKKYYKILNNEELKFESDFDFLKNVFLKFDLNLNEKAQFYLKLLQNEKVEEESFKKTVDEYKFYSKKDSVFLAYSYFKTKNENIFLYKNTKINLKGLDLINLNYPQGKIIGEILDKLLAEKLKNPNLFLSKEDEINWVKNHCPVEK